MTMNRNAGELLTAIESDSEAIARLLQGCGSSKDFGPEQRDQFETLLRHQRQLIAKLEGLRSNRMASGE